MKNVDSCDEPCYMMQRFASRCALSGYQRKEAPMVNEDQPRLRLKNGSEVDARFAYVKWSMLGALQSRQPQEVKLLFDFINAQGASNPNAHLYLRKGYRNWFEPDGTMKPIVRDVIQNSIRETPEGLVVVNPFQLSTQEERDIFKRVQDHDDRLLRSFFRDLDGPASGQSIS